MSEAPSPVSSKQTRATAAESVKAYVAANREWWRAYNAGESIWHERQVSSKPIMSDELAFKWLVFCHSPIRDAVPEDIGEESRERLKRIQQEDTETREIRTRQARQRLSTGIRRQLACDIYQPKEQRILDGFWDPIVLKKRKHEMKKQDALGPDSDDEFVPATDSDDESR